MAHRHNEPLLPRRMAPRLPQVPNRRHAAQVEDLLLTLCADVASEVQHATTVQLLPALLAWCSGTERLTTLLMPSILRRTRTLLSECAPV